MKFLSEQDMVNSSEDFENGCIPMHCGARVVNNVSGGLVKAIGRISLF